MNCVKRAVIEALGKRRIEWSASPPDCRGGFERFEQPGIHF
jgi:hypothetical protein